MVEDHTRALKAQDMKYSKNVWDQLKGKTADDLIRALLKDGYELDITVKTERIYRHPDRRRISIHYHKGSKCYGAGRGIISQEIFALDFL